MDHGLNGVLLQKRTSNRCRDKGIETMTKTRVNKPSGETANGTDGERVRVTVTYLEQLAQPILPPVTSPLSPLAILQAETPPVHYYRYLFRLIGDPWNWVSRRRLSDRELAKIIHDPKVEIYVLYVGGVPAGFCEIDRRTDDTCEIKFFGLSPDFTGKRLGRYFLTQVINLAWAGGPKRVRLETCTLDHPAALPLYQKFGFEVFDQRNGTVDLMDTPRTPD